MKNLFLVYSRRDMRHVAELRDHLSRAGYQPWVDPQPRPGQDWRPDIDEAIAHADAIIVLLTSHSAASVYATYEWAYALGLNKPIVLIAFEREVAIHPRLSAFPRYDVTGWKDRAAFWPYFVRELQLMAQPAVAPPTGILKQAQPAPEAPRKAAIPAMPAYNRDVMPHQPGYWLVVRRGPGVNTFFKLEKETIGLGRDEVNDITLKDNEVSRYHLRLMWRGDGYAVEDLESTNGTLINGQAFRGQHTLRPSDTLMLGDTVLLSYEVVS